MINQIIKNAEYIIITAGAGMSADSGLPTFRGTNGFWKTSSGKSKSYLEMANPKLFKEDPHEAWGFYGSRYNLYKETEPHQGYDLLKELVGEKKDYFIFSSNVDGHFHKAGFDKNKIVEIHGSINHFQCEHQCSTNIWEEDLNIEIKELIATDPLPKCRDCNGISRPNILMFGDGFWNSERTDNQLGRMNNFLDRITEKTVIIEIGAGTEIITVRKQSEEIAAKYNIPLIRINPEDTDFYIPCLLFPVKMKGLEGIKEILS